MANRSPLVDAYIAKQADFARPILTRLREMIHRACPSVTETIKWGMPSFEYHGLLCGFAAFKAHATFGFWKHDQVMPNGEGSREAMGSFGRMTTLRDVPKVTQFNTWMRKAMHINETRAATPKRATKPTQRASSASPATATPSTRRPKPARPPIPMPAELHAALAKSAAARDTYAKLAPSHQREYLEWITEAKTTPTRDRRIATTIEWLAEGKRRNWKYERK
ncbi:MAG: YdeI/OmpD-associated family protein [Phycisphaerales bacterium]|jgi:hypothetical protein|nr:YdeI/OmpD-associated family protein [Phycisphaerales bacterium]